MAPASLLERARRRIGMDPGRQRALWAAEAAAAPPRQRLAGFRFPQSDSRRLKVLSMNVYYGQAVGPGGEELSPPIDVDQYADLFRTGADVVALQEAVLTALPRGHPLANTARSYAARDAPGSDHWRRWTRRFPPALFREWWGRMTRLAAREGYTAVPGSGCGDAASMYSQRFGNATFVHLPRLSALGLPAPPPCVCLPALLGDSLADYQGEAEDRSAVLLDLGPLVLVNTHLSEKDTVSALTGRSSQHDMLQRVLAAVPAGRNAIIVGDFNKSDPKTVPAELAREFTVAYRPERDREPYDLLRRQGYACLPNDRATAWNARHPDQVCSNFTTAAALRKAVRVLMPVSSSGRVLSDHAALAFSVPLKATRANPGKKKRGRAVAQ